MDELKLEIERLKKEIETLSTTSKLLAEAQVVESSKEKVKKWVIGNGVYAGILLTAVGITSYKDAKEALISEFRKQSITTIVADLKTGLAPDIKKEVKADLTRDLSSSIVKEVGDQVSQSHQQIYSSLEKDIDKVSNQVSKELKIPMNIQLAAQVKDGFVFKKYLKEASPGIYTVTPYTLVVRDSPRGEVTGRIPKDTKVKIMSGDDRWVKIEIAR
jgi:hypothetical protein